MNQSDPDYTFFLAFGKNIRLYRRGKDLNIMQFADLVGMKFQQLQKIETANQRTSVYQLAIIARALDMPAGQLLEGTAFSGLSSLEKRNWQLIQENSHLKKIIEERSRERDHLLPQTSE